MSSIFPYHTIQLAKINFFPTLSTHFVELAGETLKFALKQPEKRFLRSKKNTDATDIQR